MAESESVLCVKAEVKVYRIPPRASSRGHRAADWKLDEADWSGRLRVMTRGEAAFVRLEDSHTGELFAEAPVDSYPGIAVENVTDSSRYFVLRIQDGSGRRAFIGIGFADREDAFDFNVALQEHFKRAKQEADASKREEDSDPGPKLDLGFKEGETIELQIGNVKGRDRSRPRTAAGGAVPLLPPPGGRTAGASPTRSVGNAQTRKIGGADTKATRPQADSNPIPLDKSCVDGSTPQSGWVQF